MLKNDLEVSLGEGDLVGDDDGVALAGNAHSLSNVASSAVHLDAIVQELLLNKHVRKGINQQGRTKEAISKISSSTGSVQSIVNLLDFTVLAPFLAAALALGLSFATTLGFSS